jgi:hypothetical protein
LEALGLHLERARGCEGGSRTAWSNKPSQPTEIYEKGRKTGGFAHILAYKSPKMPFIAQKYLTRYTHKMFFEEYINFKIFHY